jgi:pre-mRNA-splicing factor SYF1
MAQEGASEDLMPYEEDLLYEEELLRNPTALRLWIRYIDARQEAPAKKRFLLYERAIRKLPGSYKVCAAASSISLCTPGGLSTCFCLQLWHRYLQERARETTGLNKQALNNCYERALVTMHKMPRIWIEYIESLIQQGFVTVTRRTLDRALAALPVTQHDRLWIIYLKFVTQPDVPMDTAFRVYRRYLKCDQCP